MKTSWPFLKKLGFLSLFIYAILYANTMQFILSDYITPLWKWLVPKFSAAIGFKDVAPMEMTGSGDTTFDYFMVLFFVVVSFLIGLIVFFIDRKRPNYETANRWMMVLIRYFLAYNLIGYGFAKLFYMQFTELSMVQLDQTYGGSSPMGLLWNFMGYSQPYTMFAGFMEFIAGILLLSRKTQTVGALASFGVMLNVFMLNMCYDVPVKLLSGHMVLLSIILVLFDWKRLWNLFFSGKAIEAYTIPDLVPLKWQKVKTILKWLCLLAWLAYTTYDYYQGYFEYGPGAKETGIMGTYAVSNFDLYQDSIKQEPVPDSVQWKTFYHNWDGYAYCKSISNKGFGYNLKTDTLQQTIGIKSRKDSVYQTLHYEVEVDEDYKLHVRGMLGTDSLNFTLVKKLKKDYALINRDFHWIQEYPYNR